MSGWFRWVAVLPAVLLPVALVLGGCGAEDDRKAEPTPPEPRTAAGAKAGLVLYFDAFEEGFPGVVCDRQTPRFSKAVLTAWNRTDPSDLSTCVEWAEQMIHTSDTTGTTQLIPNVLSARMQGEDQALVRVTFGKGRETTAPETWRMAYRDDRWLVAGRPAG